MRRRPVPVGSNRAHWRHFAAGYRIQSSAGGRKVLTRCEGSQVMSSSAQQRPRHSHVGGHAGRKAATEQLSSWRITHYAFSRQFTSIYVIRLARRRATRERERDVISPVKCQGHLLSRVRLPVARVPFKARSTLGSLY